MAIGERIRSERERLGFSQTAFAELGGASKRSQIGWEQGRSYPDAEVLAAWAQAGADIGYIIMGTPSDDAEKIIAQRAKVPPEEALERVAGAMNELDLMLKGNQVNTLVDYAIKQRATVEEIKTFITRCYAVAGLPLPKPIVNGGKENE